jgi:opacity protein-like surface antigen
MKNVYTFVILALLPLLGMAQQPLEAGLFLGVANYQGDLTLQTAPRMSESNFAAGLAARTQLDEVLGVRASLLYGKLSGSDANYESRAKRAYNFSTTVIELSAVGEWEPLRRSRGSFSDGFAQRLSPYLFGGLGLALINVKPDFSSDSNPGVIKDRSADYSDLQFSIPLGLGLKIGIDDWWTVGLELGTRATFTDYLDGISQAGEPGTKDWYLFGGILAMYRIK